MTAYPLPVLSISGFHRRSSAPPPVLFCFSTSFTSFCVRLPREDCFLRSLNPIVLPRMIVFGLFVPSSLKGIGCPWSSVGPGGPSVKTLLVLIFSLSR